MCSTNIFLPPIQSPSDSRVTTEVPGEDEITSAFARMMRKIKLENKKVEKLCPDPDPDNPIDLEENPKLKILMRNENFLHKIYKSYQNDSKNYPLEDKEEDKMEKQNNQVKHNNRYQKHRDKTGFNSFDRTSYANKSCMKEFFSKYQKYNSILRKYPIKNYTPSLAFIKSSNDKKIVPNPLGLVKRVGDEEDIEMNNQKVGDRYLSVLSDSICFRSSIQSLNLRNNRLGPQGICNLFDSISKCILLYKIRVIDVSENYIGDKGTEKIIKFLEDDKCIVEKLNVYGNFLGDDNIIKIMTVLNTYCDKRMVHVDIGRNNFGDKSTKSICQFLSKCDVLKVFCMNRNNIHNQSAADIINVLISHIELRMLDLSWNSIGDDLTIKQSYEEVVNTDIKNPQKNYNNYALNETLSTMKLFLKKNPLLPPIDPKTKGKTVEKKKNDKSVNNIEKVEFKEPKKVPEKPKEPSQFAVSLGNYFTENKGKLVHFDISHNNLNSTDASLISQKIRLNHTILGIHVEGNEMEIDCLGFVRATFKDKKGERFFAESQISYGMGIDYRLRKTNIQSLRNVRSRNKCWICDGFREVKFTYVPEFKIEEPLNHLIKIHLSFDDYEPYDMLCLNGKYEIVRMCPPGEIYYFFTMDSVPVEKEGKEGENKFVKIKDCINYTFNSEYMEEFSNIREKLKYQRQQVIEDFNRKQNQENSTILKIQRKASVPNPLLKKTSFHDINTESDGDAESERSDSDSCDKFHGLLNFGPYNLNGDFDKNNKISIQVNIVSKMFIKVNKHVINEDFRKAINYTEPRPEKILNLFVRPRTPWTFPTSIWAYYGYDYNDVDEEYLDKCFLFDFDRCQFSKDFKDENELEELKVMLRLRYRDLINCYKYYSSFSGFSVWQITQNTLSDFILNRCSGFCDKNYDINNVFLIQKVVCGNLLDKEDRKKGNKNLSDNIVRHQFMNLLVKASKDKYVNILKSTKSPLESVKTSLSLHFDSAIEGFDAHEWRKKRYYNEKVDNFLKAFLPIFDGLFMSWAKQKGPRKKDVWMLFDEFNTLVQNFVDINEYPIRDNPLIFNQSKQLQINEIYTDKHINMLLPEFLEAICRAIDKASPIPPTDSLEDWPKEKRVEQPLINKLENIMPTLINLIKHPDYKILKEKFPIPVKNITTGLYEINYDSPYYQGYVIKMDEKDKKRFNKPSRQSSIITSDFDDKSKKMKSNKTSSVSIGTASNDENNTYKVLYNNEILEVPNEEEGDNVDIKKDSNKTADKSANTNIVNDEFEDGDMAYQEKEEQDTDHKNI